MTAAVRRATSDDLAAIRDPVGKYCTADGHDFDEATVEAALGPVLDDCLARGARCVFLEAAGPDEGAHRPCERRGLRADDPISISKGTR